MTRPRAIAALLVLVVGVSAGTLAGAGQAARPDVLVSLRPEAPTAASSILERAGGKLVARELDLWTLPAGSAAPALGALKAAGAVAFSEPEATHTASVSSVSAVSADDPLVGQEWWRSAIGADQLTPPGPGVPVSLVDSGVDLGHPEFAGRPNLIALNTQEPQPLGGVHGTAVASVVGAQANGVGVVGVYPDAVIRSWDAAIGTGTELTTSQIVNGIIAVSSQGKSVINLSLGGPGPDEAIKAAVDLAVARGSLVVAASGNDGEEGNTLTYPAAYPHVLTVAATQPDGSVAPWSSRSRFVDIAAPGAQIPVATVDSLTGGTGWAPEDGTSFATPIVSAAAAWLWTVRPALDAGQVAQILRQSATDIGSPGVDPSSGHGLLNLPAALATPTPVRDPNEPNDDANQVVPGRDGYHSTPALLRRSATTRVAGTVDRFEDPRDVFRVWVPKGRKLTASVVGDAATTLTLARGTAQSVGPVLASFDRLSRGVKTATGASLGYRNTAAGRFALIIVTPKTSVTTQYLLRIWTR
ncbi:S8 family peptidase [Gaiella sp.]|uniref:S8 family peptidase n=1 Tax=Gaiella sp. TaxID=2663207 RepID=UPI002E379BB4|nr:S8 family serine peptidase [Gaiella sp.]HEX5583530.1 S8 family serine peptidase [Gaiella sp.]